MFLFDTDTLSNITKKRPSEYLVKKIEKMPKSLQYTTSINLGEIYFGAFRSPHQKRILRAFEDYVFPNLNVLLFDDTSAQIYGKIKASLQKKGVRCSEPDLRIASIALQHNLTVVTGNVAHFYKIPKLAVENWIC